MRSMSGHWRRWRPQNNEAFSGTALTSLELFARVAQRLRAAHISKRAWRKKQDLRPLTTLVDAARAEAYKLQKRPVEQLQVAEAWLYALALSAPQAAVAQEEMDKHPHGYHNKEHRLFELIDFNDAFVASVLALPHDMLPHAEQWIRQLCDLTCQRAGTRRFSDEQYSAIVRGLSREIAVYLGVQKEGFEAEMTSRRVDAFGIDMRITDPKTLQSINVDLKTRSAFHYRIHNLQREGRLSEEALIMADRNGFTRVYNGHDGQKVPVVIWRIDEEEVGEIVDFTLERTDGLARMLRDIFARHYD